MDRTQDDEQAELEHFYQEEEYNDEIKSSTTKRSSAK